MKLLFIPASHTSPSARFRVLQFVEPLSRLGHDVTVRVIRPERTWQSPLRNRTLRRLHGRAGTAVRLATAGVALHDAEDFDVIFINRDLLPETRIRFLEPLLSRSNPRIVFDFDDAVFLRYQSRANGYLSYLKFPGKTATICRRARQVMVGNRYLADYATRLSDAVTVIPPTIDTEIYRPELHRPRTDAPVTIGWTGSHSTLQHLERLVPALAELARTHPFRLVVIGARAPDVPGAEVVSRRWTADTEVEDLSDIDIGLMPLPDEPWTRGKCGLKALQYMGLGIPAIVSPVGVNTEIVAHGENGLVANSDAAWIDHLKTLMHDSELRRRLGAEARRTVETRYSARVVAPKVAEIFRQAKV